MKKKLLALILSGVLCLSLGVPVGAASYPNEDVFNDAYIIFTAYSSGNKICTPSGSGSGSALLSLS